ncbi:MAG TPA: hypothetical protein VN704_06055 [Verrucomicrobiae bacterium]|nr:hypothetical protein [Verrucomicrobiae bacterium]
MKFIFIFMLGIFVLYIKMNSGGDITHLAILKDFLVYGNPNSSNVLKNGLSDHQSIGKATLSKMDNNKMKGLLVVKTTVNNKNIGNKLPSDFIINIHANDPSVVSFNGNSSGTSIKLSMGMYAVSERQIPGYFTTYSNDCFGGIMSTDTKHCIITNTYTPTTKSNTK